MIMSTVQAAQRQAEHENLLTEAIKLLKIVRADSRGYPIGVDWAQQVDTLLDQHRAQQ